MKMRSPRSSFHHLVVTCPGRRRSSSRPNAIAAWRTSVNVQRRSIRTYTWTPRPLEVVGANRPRVKRDRAHLRRPADDCHLRGTDLIRVTTRRELDPCGLHVVRSAPWNPLLKEGVATALLARRDDDARVHALRPALERRRPPLERAHDAAPDGEVVLDDVELGDRARALGRREDHAIGARHAQIAPTGVDDRGLRRRHAPEFYGNDARGTCVSGRCRGAARRWRLPLASAGANVGRLRLAVLDR